MAATQETLASGSDADRGGSFKAFLICMIVLSTTFVVLRFWSRALGPRVSHGNTLHRFWWDDWIALLALVSLLSFVQPLRGILRLSTGLHDGFHRDRTRFSALRVGPPHLDFGAGKLADGVQTLLYRLLCLRCVAVSYQNIRLTLPHPRVSQTCKSPMVELCFVDNLWVERRVVVWHLLWHCFHVQASRKRLESIPTRRVWDNKCAMDWKRYTECRHRLVHPPPTLAKNLVSQNRHGQKDWCYTCIHFGILVSCE